MFFLRPFTIERQRRIRIELSKLSDMEEGMDWGKDFLYLGYPWSDSSTKTPEDLRNLFETCDPFSASYDPHSPDPFRFTSYPHHFIAIDDAILDERPKVWLCSSLDFHGADVNDQLGWSYGGTAGSGAYLAYSNLSIANMGPRGLIEDEEDETVVERFGSIQREGLES